MSYLSLFYRKGGTDKSDNIADNQRRVNNEDIRLNGGILEIVEEKALGTSLINEAFMGSGFFRQLSHAVLSNILS